MILLLLNLQEMFEYYSLFLKLYFLNHQYLYNKDYYLLHNSEMFVGNFAYLIFLEIETLVDYTLGNSFFFLIYLIFNFFLNLINFIYYFFLNNEKR